jgi:membrane-associated phospholipid phosphatase
MRSSEWIQAGFATILAIAAWLVPLSFRRRSTIALLAACAIVVVVLARISAYLLPSDASSILRDWLPVLLMFVPYWQTGQMFTGPNEKIQDWLVESDHRLLQVASRVGFKFGPSARLTMEWAYALCYPMVPSGLGVLYMAGKSWAANAFWFLVLVPTYLCYAITPFVPALPPRSLENGANSSATKSRVFRKSRVFNLWLLKYGSIQAISFPSAHVAASLAVSLVLIHLVPLAGWIFLVITFWIAVAAVVGRYHYFIDVVLGAALTLAVFAAWYAHLIPKTLITAPATALLAWL